MSVSKQLLRDKFRSIRNSDANTHFCDKKIAEVLLESKEFKNADTVFCYYSVNSEVDTLGIIRYLLETDVKVALPFCVDGEGQMEFYFITSFDDLIKGRFSSLEPDIERCERAVFTEKTVCLVPGLAFDKRGYRLGYGKGYYDRFLEKFCGVSIGLCRENCLCELLPEGRFDKKINLLITENQYIKFNSKEEYKDG